MQQVLRPQVDYNRCDGKGVCVQVCPWHVFDLQVLSLAQQAPLTWSGRLHAILRGGRVAVVSRAQDCHACGACVRECPEQAIRLV